MNKMDHEQRKGDVRVYIVSGLFFSCIVSGGVFLGLYMFLPETQYSSWYPIAGMILVSIPWAFWFLTFVYRCFKPLQPPPQHPQHLSSRFSKGPSSLREPAALAVPVTPNAAAAVGPACESPGGGGDRERKVQFGGVVVLGGNGDGIGEREMLQNDNETSEASNCSRESEMPLRLSI